MLSSASQERNPMDKDTPCVFCLEVFVSHVHSLKVSIQKPAVVFRLLDFPTIVAKAPEGRSFDIATPTFGGAVSFSVGKSVLFKLPQVSFRETLRKIPLWVMLCDLENPDKAELLGSTSIDLSCFVNQLELPPQDSRRGYRNGDFQFGNFMGTKIGTLQLVLRLSSVGAPILSHLGMATGKENHPSLPQQQQQQQQQQQEPQKDLLIAAKQHPQPIRHTSLRRPAIPANEMNPPVFASVKQTDESRAQTARSRRQFSNRPLMHANHQHDDLPPPLFFHRTPAIQTQTVVQVEQQQQQQQQQHQRDPQHSSRVQFDSAKLATDDQLMKERGKEKEVTFQLSPSKVYAQDFVPMQSPERPRGWHHSGNEEAEREKEEEDDDDEVDLNESTRVLAQIYHHVNQLVTPKDKNKSKKKKKKNMKKKTTKTGTKLNSVKNSVQRKKRESSYTFGVSPQHPLLAARRQAAVTPTRAAKKGKKKLSRDEYSEMLSSLTRSVRGDINHSSRVVHAIEKSRSPGRRQRRPTTSLQIETPKRKHAEEYSPEGLFSKHKHSRVPEQQPGQGGGFFDGLMAAGDHGGTGHPIVGMLDALAREIHFLRSTEYANHILEREKTQGARQFQAGASPPGRISENTPYRRKHAPGPHAPFAQRGQQHATYPEQRTLFAHSPVKHGRGHSMSRSEYHQQQEELDGVRPYPVGTQFRFGSRHAPLPSPQVAARIPLPRDDFDSPLQRGGSSAISAFSAKRKSDVHHTQVMPPPPGVRPRYPLPAKPANLVFSHQERYRARAVPLPRASDFDPKPAFGGIGSVAMGALGAKRKQEKDEKKKSRSLSPHRPISGKASPNRHHRAIKPKSPAAAIPSSTNINSSTRIFVTAKKKPLSPKPPTSGSVHHTLSPNGKAAVPARPHSFAFHPKSPNATTTTSRRLLSAPKSPQVDNYDDDSFEDF